MRKSQERSLDSLRSKGKRCWFVFNLPVADKIQHAGQLPRELGFLA